MAYALPPPTFVLANDVLARKNAKKFKKKMHFPQKSAVFKMA